MPKTNIFEVGQLFFKKILFFENNNVERSTKNFYEKFRPFPATIKIHHYLPILNLFWGFSPKIGDLADSAGRPADVAELI